MTDLHLSKARPPEHVGPVTARRRPATHCTLRRSLHADDRRKTSQTRTVKRPERGSTEPALASGCIQRHCHLEALLPRAGVVGPPVEEGRSSREWSRSRPHVQCTLHERAPHQRTCTPTASFHDMDWGFAHIDATPVGLAAQTYMPQRGCGAYEQCVCRPAANLLAQQPG